MATVKYKPIERLVLLICAGLLYLGVVLGEWVDRRASARL